MLIASYHASRTMVTAVPLDQAVLQTLSHTELSVKSNANRTDLLAFVLSCDIVAQLERWCGVAMAFKRRSFSCYAFQLPVPYKENPLLMGR